MSMFTPQRESGQSNAQVLIDFVRDGAPGQIYEVAHLLAALDVGAEKAHTTSDLVRAVSTTNKRLLKEYQRRLHSVRGRGYRLACASEHLTLASSDRRRADTQLKKGLATLRHVRWDELPEEARKAHEGHLMVTEAIYQAQASQERRLRKVEAAIASLTGAA